MTQPAYYSILTADVRYDERLSANAKLLYSEITALCDKHGYCWANNEYFAKIYKVSHQSVSTWIKQLKDCKYIFVEILKDEGNKRIITLEEVHKKTLIGTQENLMTPRQEKFKTPHQENLIHNSTSKNNTSINITSNSNKLVSKLPTDSHFLKLKKEKQTDTLLEEIKSLVIEGQIEENPVNTSNAILLDHKKPHFDSNLEKLTSRCQEANLPTPKDPPDPPPEIEVKNKKIEKFNTFKNAFMKIFNVKPYDDRLRINPDNKAKLMDTFEELNPSDDEIWEFTRRFEKFESKEQARTLAYLATAFADKLCAMRDKPEENVKEVKEQKVLPPSKITLPKDLEEINQQFREEISLNFRIGIVEGQFTNKVLIIGFKDNKIPIVLFANENLKNCISLHYNLKLEKVLEKLCQRTLKGFEMKVANKECGRFEVGYE